MCTGPGFSRFYFGPGSRPFLLENPRNPGDSGIDFRTPAIDELANDVARRLHVHVQYQTPELDEEKLYVSSIKRDIADSIYRLKK